MATAAPVYEDVLEAPRPAGAWTLAWRRVRRDRLAVASGFALVLIIFAVFAGGPILSRIVGHGPNELFPFAVSNLKPVGFWSHVPDVHETGPINGYGEAQVPKGAGSTLLIFGADSSLGRDLLLRLLYGGRVSLEVALGATLLALLIGVLLGGVAAYFGGWVDAIISRFTDLVMAFPLLLLLVLIGSTVTGDKLTRVTLGGILNKGVFLLILLIGAFTWFYPARIVRSQVLALREREFVEAARMTGASDFRILRRHLVPHVLPSLVAFAMVAVATNILLEAGVTFLGAGVQLPTASWGSLLGVTWGTVANPTPYNPETFTIWPTLLPSLMIFLTVLAFNTFGEALRNALDPQAVA
jgi:peptide/nickel transport system permease protein/oligopeptide transport system permease protein